MNAGFVKRWLLLLLLAALGAAAQEAAPPEPKPDDTNADQANPAGLVLYWLVNNVLSIAQQWQITRMMEGEAASAKKK